MSMEDPARTSATFDSPEARPSVLSLECAQASKITSISLYSGRAEITRSFKLAVAEGQNQISIRGLPDRLEKDSVRVEGRGHASIHDVAIFKAPQPSQESSESSVDAIIRERKRRELKNQIASVKQTRSALNAYLGTLRANEVDVSKLGDIFTSHNLLARKLDNDILDLENELVEMTQKIDSKPYWEDLPPRTPRVLSWQLTINVWVEIDEIVEILVKYVVSNADWSANYDIRADTQNPGNNLVILYKAAITQSTGESWDAVPLILETANPMLGILAPSLSPWNISEAKPKRTTTQHPKSRSRTRSQSPHRYRRRQRERDRDLEVDRARYDRSASRSPRRRARSLSPIDTPIMQHQAMVASNKGSSAATFRIPGYVNIPSDAQQHNVTIATVEVRAVFLWRTIPKIDTRVYMTATITNQSAYTLIPGSANIYVDGSFVATTVIPLVNPRETFTCALGLDSFLRVKYQPALENTTVKGLYKRYTNKTYSYQITIRNTKTTPIENLHVVDNIPVSQDERINVNLLVPELSPPTAENISSLENMFKLANTRSSSHEASGHRAQSMEKVQVMAHWDGEGEPNIDPNTVGKNGQVNWKVALEPQETVTLTLKYEVSYPENLVVEGM